MPGNIRDFLKRVNREPVYILKLLAIPTYEYVFRRITRRLFRFGISLRVFDLRDQPKYRQCIKVC